MANPKRTRGWRSSLDIRAHSTKRRDKAAKKTQADIDRDKAEFYKRQQETKQ